MAEDNKPTNVVDLDNQVVIDTEYGSGRDITVTVDKNGNVVLFRGTDDPNRGINVNFESSVGRGEVGYGKGNYYSPNPQYAANYAQGGGRKLYGYSTDIKPNEIINFRTKISDNIELAKKLGVEDIYWDVSNPNYKSFSWADLFYEMDKEDVWNEAIGNYEVTKKSKYGRSWFQNNIDTFKDNGVKAFITTEVGSGSFTRAEIFPLVTETNNLNIKPVVQYSVDGAGVNLSQFTEIPLDTPTNVVDEGIELFHSRAKGVDIGEGLHAGTYNAALDKAAMQYNNINFYNWAFDAQEQIAIAHNNLVDIHLTDLQLELEDLKDGDFIPFSAEEPVYFEWVTGEETEYILQIEGEIGLQNGEYINNLEVNLYTGDKDGYRGDLIVTLETDVSYAGLEEIANNPDIAKISKTDTRLQRPGIDSSFTTNSLDIAEHLLEEVGTGYSFSGEKGYDLYKVTVKPDANILELPGEIILQIDGRDVTWTADELQNTLIDTNSSELTKIEQITIGDKTIQIPDDARRKDVSKLLFGDYDVIIYKNQGEDPGSKSYLFKDSNSYTIEKIDDVKFNDDVNKKFYGTNKYDYYSDKAYKFKDQETFKKYQVKEYNPNFTFTDTSTTVAGAEVIDEIEGIQRETIEKLRNANDAFVAEQVDDIMARKINEVLPFVDTSISRAEAIGISTTGSQITTSADPTLNTFIDDIEKITGQTLDITEKRKLRQFMYDVAKGNDNLLNDSKFFIPALIDSVDNSKLNNPGYKIWKNWQNSGAFPVLNIGNMTPNEFTAFGPPDYVYLVEGLEKSGESINFTAISDADVNIPDTPGGSLGAAKLNDPLVFDSWVDNYANTTTSFVDNLPLVKPVKDMFLNAADHRLKRLARQAATPGGILDAVDIYEMAVLTLVAGAIAYNEIDEIPKITKNAILRTYNLSQGRPIDAPLRVIGLPTLEISEYDIDFEYAMETLEKAEEILPYDRTIKHLQGLEVSNDYVSTYLPKDTTDKDKNYNPYQERVEEVKELTANIKREKVKQDLLESKGVQEEKMFEQAKPKKSKATGGAGAKIL